MIDGPFTLILEALLAIALVYAAAVDVRTFTISNRFNIGVAVVAPLYWLSRGLPLWPDCALYVAVAIGVFLLLAILFVIGMMGGGDVKLAAALGLWFGPENTPPFLIYTSLAGGLVTLFFVALHKVKKREGQPEIPYGVAIAIGAIAILAQRFLNQFV